MVRGESPFERQCWMYESTSCGEMIQGGFSAHEKKSARSLMVCFLALECGYWQVSQFENWVSSVCMVPPEDGFSGGYHQEAGRARIFEDKSLI
jgi:hypothetical protein